MHRWDLLELDAPDGTRDPVVLHSDNAARAVLLVLQPGQALGDHQVKENAWVVVVDGEIEIAAEGETTTCGAGTLARFDADERHALRSAGGARVLLMLSPWPGDGHYRPGA